MTRILIFFSATLQDKNRLRPFGVFLFLAGDQCQLGWVVDVGVVGQWCRHQVLRIGVFQEFTDQLNITNIQVSEWFVNEDETTGTIFRFQETNQEDQGFRLARIRNKATAMSSGECIIFIDGDMILHPSFITDHKRHAKIGRYIQGSRVLIDKNTTLKALQTGIISFSPLYRQYMCL